MAKLLGLGYPGGPVSIGWRARATTARIDFPTARLTHADRNAPKATSAGLLPPDVARRIDFSFSGLKTAVLRLVRERTGAGAQGRATDADGAGAALPRGEVADICASFQRVVVDVLLDRTFEAARWLGARSVGIAGGVSANSHLRAEAEARARRAGLPVFVPPIALSTDNAAMIGAAGFSHLARHGSGRGTSTPKRACRWGDTARGSGLGARDSGLGARDRDRDPGSWDPGSGLGQTRDTDERLRLRRDLPTAD